MKRKKIAKIGAALCAVLLLGYVFLTPMGALRVGVLLTGHPMSAFTMRVRQATPSDVGLRQLDHPKGTTIYHIDQNTPYEKPTRGTLENWIVTRYGIFYTAAYYGYC